MKRIWAMAIAGICAMLMGSMRVQAYTLDESPYVHWSPTHGAWTVDNLDQSYTWYPEGTEVYTGIPLNIPVPGSGRHIYGYMRADTVPIYKWEVKWADHTGIHHETRKGPDRDVWNGIVMDKTWDGTLDSIAYVSDCERPLDSGWWAVCADCGEYFRVNVYGTAEAVASISWLDMSYDYYSICKYEGGIEQGTGFSHECAAVSYNMYAVTYEPNVPPGGAYSGWTADSYHMWDDANVYDGEPVAPQKTLNPNGFERRGYKFRCWNTRPDGSGTDYADMEEVHNLATGDVNHGEPDSRVTLYAQWDRCSSVLEIDPNGGTYNGSSDTSKVTGEYGDVLVLDPSGMEPPPSVTVHFETGGGSAVPDMQLSREFDYWQMDNPMHGTFDGTAYGFGYEDGVTDKATAQWGYGSFRLPGCSKPNSQFAGWYYDPEHELPAGPEGTELTPTRDMTLYAGWANLVLYSEDNYTAYSRTGAADLTWEMAGATSANTYKLYRSADGGRTWEHIGSPSDIGSGISVNGTYSPSGTKTYTVPYAGTYQITGSGAQGGMFGTKSGGLGGRVAVTVWLERGEVLTYSVGAQDGSSDSAGKYAGGSIVKTGNTAYGAPGGGATQVSSSRQGLLLVAAGGGGATLYYDGYGGGSGGPTAAGTAGEAGSSGGGGGYQGGAKGEFMHDVQSYMDNGWATSVEIRMDSGTRDGCGMSATSGHSWAVDVDAGMWGWPDMVDDSGYTTGTVTKTIPLNGASTLEFSLSSGNGSLTGYDSSGNVILSRSGTSMSVDVSSCAKVTVSATNTASINRSGHRTVYIEIEKLDITYMISSAAYGGTNYAGSTAYSRTLTGSANAGNGSLSIKSLSVGFITDNKLDGVKATDMAAPDAVDKRLLAFGAQDASHVSVSWQEPADNGTPYLFKAEARLIAANIDTQQPVESNWAENILTSGIAGYYVKQDTSPSTAVNASNGTFQAGRSFTMSGTGKVWLHVAPVDVAGNIGPTVHIEADFSSGIFEGDTPVNWPLRTGQVTVEGTDNNVYAHPLLAKAYYVRADGSTKFILVNTAVLDGGARDGYQPDRSVFETWPEGSTDGTVSHRYRVPNNILSSDRTSIQYAQDGMGWLADTLDSNAVRSDAMKRLTLRQGFRMDASFNGLCLSVIPRASADAEDGSTAWSSRADDMGNGVMLIADSEAPVIHGMDVLDQLSDDPTLIDRLDGSFVLDIWCEDSGSGVRDIVLTVENRDNHTTESFYPDGDGHIRVDIVEDNYLFGGDFTASAVATDNVGNVGHDDRNVFEFALEASITRILESIEPREGIFRRGESGWLDISAWGYADKVTVEFPSSWTALDPSLDTEYVWDKKDFDHYPEYLKKERWQFMVPLYLPMPEDGSVRYDEVIVTAYKDGRTLTARLPIAVVDGTVLDTFRDRLRARTSE